MFELNIQISDQLDLRILTNIIANELKDGLSLIERSRLNSVEESEV